MKDLPLHEWLRKYYQGELSPAERNALERRALEDPFLKEAMDGFDENPESFSQFYNRHKNQLNTKKNYTLLIGALVLLAFFGVTTLLNRQSQTISNPTMAENTTSIDTISKNQEIMDDEYEVLPTEIETLVFIPEKELISAEEVVRHQTKITEPEKTENITIEVNEPIDITEEYTIQPENWHKKGQESIPITYLYNLRVVDYREMTRENQEITYKRYDLGGLPANMEGENQSNTDLIESEVIVPYHLYLTKSMSFFAGRNFKQALNRYLLILEQYPEDMNALFYGGLAYYNLGKYQKSIAFFDQIISSEIPVFKEEALWYKAKSYLQLDEKIKASQILEEIIAKGGFYTKDAIDLKASIR